MGLNAKQFAERCGRKDTAIIKKWYDAGYLGDATKDEKTGVYDIPEDTPIPYAANVKTQRNSTLRTQLLDAADKNQMVVASMYPLISNDDFRAQLQEMIDNNLLEVVTTVSGQSYLRIKSAGQAILANTSTAQERKSVFEKIERIMSNSANTITIVQALISLGFFVASLPK